MSTKTKFKSPLHQTVMTTSTDFWNDSCSIEELVYAIEHGAVGATSNPTIVLAVLNKEMHLWRERIDEIIASDIEVKERMDDPVPPIIIDELERSFSDFRRAYEIEGMSIDEFDSYGPTVRTLRGFIQSFYDLVAVVRDFMLPNPDLK